MGEAQNVNIDPEEKGKLGGTSKDAEQATQKATEGIRQGRDDSQRSRNNDVNNNDNDQFGNG